MLEEHAFRVMLAESSYQEYEFRLAQPFLFVLRGILYQIKPHMENVGYESSLLVLD
jgi:hypothetical protein